MGGSSLIAEEFFFADGLFPHNKLIIEGVKTRSKKKIPKKRGPVRGKKHFPETTLFLAAPKGGEKN